MKEGKYEICCTVVPMGVAVHTAVSHIYVLQYCSRLRRKILSKQGGRAVRHVSLSACKRSFVSLMFFVIFVVQIFTFPFTHCWVEVKGRVQLSRC